MLKTVVLSALSASVALTLVSHAGDAAPGTWNTAASMHVKRASHTATLLPDGRVLVVGGFDFDLSYLSSAEIYDPGTNTWTLTADSGTYRSEHAAALLPDGRVLVAGGDSTSNSGRIYNPATDSWAATPNLSTNRWGNSAVLLPNGKVLVAGGKRGTPESSTSTSEVYDPLTNTWSVPVPVPFNTGGAMLTSLLDGRVLAVGRFGAAMYNPLADSWQGVTPPTLQRGFGALTLLTDGRVLVTGTIGLLDDSPAEIYEPATDTWSFTDNTNFARWDHKATRLPDGRVIVTGGYPGKNSAESFEPATSAWAIEPSMPTPHALHTATLLMDGRVLVAGGVGDNRPDNKVDIFSPPLPPTATLTATPTPAGPIVNKSPTTANLFLCEVGPCSGPGEGDVVISEIVANVTEPLGAWEIQIKFDHKVFNVAIDPNEALFTGFGRTPNCSVQVVTENWILFGCVSTGPVGSGFTGGPATLATVTLTPNEDLRFRLHPGNDNGVVRMILDENCEIANTLGHPQPGSVNGGLAAECGDASVTVRILEGDLNLDCSVDLLDQQLIAGRYGTFFGNIFYDPWFDLEPALKDFDIDIKDLQKVFGRDGSTCQAPIPAQPPAEGMSVGPL